MKVQKVISIEYVSVTISSYNSLKTESLKT